MGIRRYSAVRMRKKPDSSGELTELYDVVNTPWKRCGFKHELRDKNCSDKGPQCCHRHVVAPPNKRVQPYNTVIERLESLGIFTRTEATAWLSRSILVGRAMLAVDKQAAVISSELEEAGANRMGIYERLSQLQENAPAFNTDLESLRTDLRDLIAGIMRSEGLPLRLSLPLIQAAAI